MVNIKFSLKVFCNHIILEMYDKNYYSTKFFTSTFHSFILFSIEHYNCYTFASISIPSLIWFNIWISTIFKWRSQQGSQMMSQNITNKCHSHIAVTSRWTHTWSDYWHWLETLVSECWVSTQSTHSWMAWRLCHVTHSLQQNIPLVNPTKHHSCIN